MIAITGYLSTVDENGIQWQESKTFKKFGLRAKLYFFKMRLFYDYVEVREYD